MIISFVTFILLSLIQAIYIYFKWDTINEYIELSKNIGGVVGVTNHIKFKRAVRVTAQVIRNFRSLLIIPIGLLTIINLIISFILGGIISVVLLIF